MKTCIFAHRHITVLQRFQLRGQNRVRTWNTENNTGVWVKDAHWTAQQLANPREWYWQRRAKTKNRPDVDDAWLQIAVLRLQETPAVCGAAFASYTASDMDCCVTA